MIDSRQSRRPMRSSWIKKPAVPLPVQLGREFGAYMIAWGRVGSSWVTLRGRGLESGKGWLAERLYKQRGKWVRPFSHAGMAGLTMSGVLLAPVVASGYSALVDSHDEWQWNAGAGVLLAAEAGTVVETMESVKPRDKVWEHVVKPGETLSQIADTYNVSLETIKWENNLSSPNAIKPGQTLRILPVTGVRHTVKKGETIYSIAKKYEAEPQAIVDFPFNSFANDETFALALGQDLIVPEGVMPEPKQEAPRSTTPSYMAQTPSGGATTGSGKFVWPTGGRLTQKFSWYHKAIDIANKAAPDVVAADGGTVVIAGWPDQSGYGNRILIDHGNGYTTLYGHLQKLYVSAGQRVSRGQTIGQMGSTGRSTGTHLHFEIRSGGGNLNPLNFLN